MLPLSPLIFRLLQAPDKHTLLQIAEISADLEATTSLRPPLHIVKTAIPKDIQMTVSREEGYHQKASCEGDIP